MQKSFLSEKIAINYLYCTILFLTISSLSLSYFLSLEGPVSVFFLLQVFGQAILEVGAFVFITQLFYQRAPRWINHCFIAFSFAFLLVHFTDFTMIRIMDIPISYMFKFLFGDGTGHILTAFRALNLNTAMIAMSAGLLFLIPSLGILLYYLTFRAIQRKPLKASLNQIALTLGAVAASLLILDVCAPPSLTRPLFIKHQKALPFGTTFLPPSPKCISLPRSLAPPKEEKLLEHLPPFAAPATPNIYVFVIETLRKDFITRETAPHLVSFADENIQLPHSFANANGTQLSWFSIFHADFPLHWAAVRDRWTKGSLPLQILKKLGYEIHVYSSAELRHFSMDKLLFGETLSLLDAIEDYSLNRLLEPCERDALAFQSFERDIKTEKGRTGNVFLFFLDATHSEYSFPKDFPLKFEPIPKQIDYLTLTQKDIEPIKNRYRNSIAYVDSLMGRFFETLKQERLYDESIIAITGDHGEEFFEEGALFHGTHLNRFQTSVPLLFKFQDNAWPVQTDTVTHIDLFPSILHYLTKQPHETSLFDGHSIFTKREWPYRIAVLQNGPDISSEFTIENESVKITARFLNPRNIHSQTQLEILSLEMPSLLPEPPPANASYEKIIENQFPNVFDPLLKNSPNS